MPAAYLENLDVLRNVQRSHPMLIYQASRPFRARVRTDLTYDVLNPATVARLIRSAKPVLPELLAFTEARLRDVGWHAVADQYRPKRAAQIIEDVQRLSKSRKCLYILVRSEGMLINGLIELGGLGDLKPREQTRKTALFEKRWSFELRRLYPGTDFLWLAPVLLESATHALRTFQNERVATEAIVPFNDV